MVKICIISDTHGKHRQIKELPEADILIHAGDFSNVGELFEVIDFNMWLGEIKDKFKHIVVIAGNHELTFSADMRLYNPSMKKVLTNCIYLENESVELEGLKLYGSPTSPAFMGWAFNKERGAEIAREWAKIPNDVNVLIVHGPPYGFNDKLKGQGALGCKDLANRISQLDECHLIISGHIHAGYGMTKWKDKTYINAALLSEAYKMSNDPFLVNYYEDGMVL